MHYRLSVSFAKASIERISVILGEVIPNKGLSAVFVNSLEHLYCHQSHVYISQVEHPTLYAAAYPSPGNNEIARFGIDAVAFSLNMTELSCETEVT